MLALEQCQLHAIAVKRVGEESSSSNPTHMIKSLFTVPMLLNYNSFNCCTQLEHIAPKLIDRPQYIVVSQKCFMAETGQLVQNRDHYTNNIKNMHKYINFNKTKNIMLCVKGVRAYHCGHTLEWSNSVKLLLKQQPTGPLNKVNVLTVSD